MLVVLSHTRRNGSGAPQIYYQTKRRTRDIRCPDCGSDQYATGATGSAYRMWEDPAEIEQCYCKECGKEFFLEWRDRI